ncbi:hypothetical protein [Hugenholtzia roseola]|uniref:hypothetical protein n=1 Tax=Hugenholtzia roseola TaxID=1002 RepID=UPI0003F9617A|nr:hypothetical protein [Hugenholtzia roseola]
MARLETSAPLVLDEAQVELIWKRIEASQITNEELKNSLLDHFCCFIEEKINEGYAFEESYQKAFAAISPNGLQEIEEELFFMLHFQTQLNMKRILYVSGFFVAFTFTLYLLFRHLKWEGSHFFLQSGNYLLALLVLPILAVMGYQNRRSLNFGDKARLILGILSTEILSIGMIFKGLHFPGANILFVSGTAVFAFVFLPLFFYQLYQRSAQSQPKVVA